MNSPLGLATLAALCPADWDIAIVDENIEALPLRPRADVIGVCGMGIQFRRQRELLQFYRSIEKRLRAYAGAGRVEMALRRNHATVPDLCIDLKGWLDPRLSTRALRCVEKMLKRTRSRVMLGIGEVQQQHVRHLNQSLRRLARYGDCIFIAASDTLREHAAINWSRFNLILDLPDPVHNALSWERKT